MGKVKVEAPVYERWAFSESELADPSKCNGFDELVAYIDIDDEYEGTDGQQILVYRNGRATNRYANGTVGVPEALALLAEVVESLLHDDGGDTAGWRDVETDKAGAFIQFLPNPLDLPKS